MKCSNCIFLNSKYNTNKNVNHSPYDREKCSILKNKIKNYIDNIDYPIEPEIPKYLTIDKKIIEKLEEKQKKNSKI